MSLIITKQERETFLADVHVGIISISEDGRGPLTVPIWYAYDVGGDLRIMTGRESRKGRLLARAAGLVSACRRKLRRTSTSAWKAPSLLLKRRISSAICVPSPAVISEKKWGTVMWIAIWRRRLRIAITSLSACAPNDG